MIKRLILFLNRKGHKYIRREAPSAPPLGELLSEREAEGVRLDEWNQFSHLNRRGGYQPPET